MSTGQAQDLSLLVAMDTLRIDGHEITAPLACLHHIWLPYSLKVGHCRYEDYLLSRILGDE